MTRLLEDAVAAVRRLPSARQDEIALAMLGLAERDDEAEDIDLAHLAAIREGLGEVERGDFAGDAEVADILKRFGA